MKKTIKIVGGILILAIIICGIVFAVNNKEQSEEGKESSKEHTFNSNNEIKTALTLKDEIQNNTIWCGTFQLIWNDLKNDLAKQDITFTPQKQIVKNLNEETFTTKDISEQYYYKKVGTPSIQLKEEIEKAIKEKFNETSDILDQFDWDKKSKEDYFLYVKKRISI